MKTQLPLTVLLVLFGCGASAPEQQSQTQVIEPSAVTTASEFTGKVIKVIDGDTIDVLTDDKETIRAGCMASTARNMDSPSVTMLPRH